MSESPEIATERLNIFSAIGQLAAIVAPLLFLLGQKYASAYFTELDCGWAIKYFSFQETVFYSLPTALPIMGGMLTTLQLMLDDIPFKTILKFLSCSALLLALTITVTYIFSKFHYWDAIQKIATYWIFVTFGSYLADLFLEFKAHNHKKLKSTIALTIGSLLIVFNMAESLGDLDAKNATENANKFFPILTNGHVFGATATMRLIAKIGDKYLIQEKSQDSVTYQIKSSLDPYAIHSLDK